MVLFGSLSDCCGIHTTKVPARHLHNSNRPIPGTNILCIILNAQLMFDHFGAADGSVAGIFWKGNILGKAPFMARGLGIVFTNYHLCCRSLLESRGYANRQIREMVGGEMCGRKEVVI